MLPLKVEEYEYGPSDARLDNMKDYSVYFVGASLVDWGDVSYMSIIKDKAGKFYIQKFTVEAYGGVVLSPKLALVLHLKVRLRG